MWGWRFGKQHGMLKVISEPLPYSVRMTTVAKMLTIGEHPEEIMSWRLRATGIYKESVMQAKMNADPVYTSYLMVYNNHFVAFWLSAMNHALSICNTVTFMVFFTLLISFEFYGSHDRVRCSYKLASLWNPGVVHGFLCFPKSFICTTVSERPSQVQMMKQGQWITLSY